MAKIAYFDTETTGLDPKKDRICSLAILLMDDGAPVFAKEYFFNPQRPVPPEAAAVHGLTDEFLAQQPTFAEQLPQIHADWVQADEHVAHNADYDVKFISAETSRLGAVFSEHPISFVNVTDTLKLAKALYPAASVTLDRLCDMLGVDRSSRAFHGALLDCELLAKVHVKLLEQQAVRRSILADILQVDNLEDMAKADLAKRAEIYSRLKGWGNMIEALQGLIRDSVLDEVPASTEGPGFQVDYRNSTKTKWELVAKAHVPDLASVDLSPFQSTSTALHLTWKG